MLLLRQEAQRSITKNTQQSEQQIIFEVFGYLTPSKFNQLSKIISSFFGLSKDTPENENQLGKTYKNERKSTKKPDPGIQNMMFHYTLLIL